MSPFFDPSRADLPEDSNNNTRDFAPMPAGWYYVTIIGSEATYGNKVDAGEMLKLTVQVDGEHHPDHGGRLVWSYLCVNHESRVPRQIAHKNLVAILAALGLDTLEDPQDVIGGRLLARLKIRPASGNYEASNDINSWKAEPDQRQAAPAQRAPSKQAPAKPAGQRRSWRG